MDKPIPLPPAFANCTHQTNDNIAHTMQLHVYYVIVPSQKPPLEISCLLIDLSRHMHENTSTCMYIPV